VELHGSNSTDLMIEAQLCTSVMHASTSAIESGTF